jgi:hypothetical protein
MRVTKQDIEDVLTTAMYGGIDYWAEEVDVEPPHLGLTDGAEVKIKEDEGEWHLLTVEDMEEAIRKYCGKDYWEVDGTLLTGIIDAADADAIIQLAIFKEQVYG